MSSRWIGFGSILSFPGLVAANKSTSCGLIKVCKTFIRRFDSDPRLQHLAAFSAVYLFPIVAFPCRWMRRNAGECWIRFGSPSRGVSVA